MLCYSYPGDDGGDTTHVRVRTFLDEVWWQTFDSRCWPSNTCWRPYCTVRPGFVFILNGNFDPHKRPTISCRHCGTTCVCVWWKWKSKVKGKFSSGCLRYCASVLTVLREKPWAIDALRQSGCCTLGESISRYMKEGPQFYFKCFNNLRVSSSKESKIANQSSGTTIVVITGRLFSAAATCCVQSSTTYAFETDMKDWVERRKRRNRWQQRIGNPKVGDGKSWRANNEVITSKCQWSTLIDLFVRPFFPVSRDIRH